MIWLAVVLAVLLVGLILMYNRLVAMRRLTENAWADVDVYLKRRADLVPNLVEAVKGAAAFESGTLEGVVQARNQAAALAGPTSAKADAETAVSQGVGRIVAVAENYPDLKTSANFLQLQRDLSDNEKLIASARQYYNACVRDYNTMLESFPQSVLANSTGFKTKDFFEIENLPERAAPAVTL